ncbi:hypothetical protein [Hymenobacter cheonanensis]|uniref:hypothetical protein n=1 Tax=Hymenobacter sp. CA2-7 TaxID=3063993 RepID=UPI0027126F71|nr:hypothetical protein [Hymenobacter sp. CA2-7]MDO7888117.1 hypothetical protein [Hymenobacter sp. CA2-7]
MPNSEGITDVRKLAQELHDNKVINLNTSVGDLLKAAQGVGTINKGHGGDVMDSVVAWSGYVVVTKGKPADMSQLERLGKQNIGGQH